MAESNALKAQYQVRASAMQIQEEMKDMKIFEEDMKRKEMEMRENAINLKLQTKDPVPQKEVPVRSSIEDFQKYSEEEKSIERILKLTVADEGNEEEKAAKRKAANDFKEEGTKFFKLKDYEGACKMYTAAIDNYDGDPIFYSNRSQCYILLNRFQEAIEDASIAIKLDSKSQKPHFRRMTGYEKLGEVMKALQCVQEWMIALPDDTMAKNAYDRIHNKIIQMNKQKEMEKIKWSKLQSKTHFVDTAAHLRSNKPLNKVSIRNRKSQSPIPDEVIDKLFQNNTGERVPEVQTDSKLFKPNFLVAKPTPLKEPNTSSSSSITKEKVNETNEILKAAANDSNNNLSNSNKQEEENKSLPTMEELEQMKEKSRKDFSLPISGPLFHSTWIDLNEQLKFIYLMGIAKQEQSFPLGTLIGAQLDSSLLSELIHVIHKYFIHFNVPYVSLLHELSKNAELNILSLFLENDDKVKLNELLNIYSSSNNSDNTVVQQIKNSFQI